MNNHKVHELYNLDATAKQVISLKELCHQFIHSMYSCWYLTKMEDFLES
jgi:hypothetical protein